MAVTIVFVKESASGERRAALSPETCKKLLALKTRVVIERGAGAPASFVDDAYAGAEITGDRAGALATADIVLCVQPPSNAELSSMKEGAILIGLLAPHADPARVDTLVARRITAFPLEKLPRTTRAQAMDVLSSQAGMAGYKAVLIAAQLAPRFFPMLTTAAGTIRPSKVLIVGAGVAGLQAIATARRLGAQVEGFDVRPETREQIESLGGKFLDLGDSSTV
jgi:NAD(P) transhydrogenase subunit alpha